MDIEELLVLHVDSNMNSLMLPWIGSQRTHVISYG